MKGFLAACMFLAVAVASADPLQADFDAYCRKFNKKYDSGEYKVRLQYYRNTRMAIDEHDNGNNWHVGINEMSDWSAEEFRALLGYRHVNISAYGFKPPVAFEYNPSQSTRHSIDWRNHGVLTAVKNQGGCGSCWSFSAAETLESQYAMVTGHLEVLSEQNILDCTPNPNECGGTGGCMGGTAELAFGAMQMQGGLASEWTYPYQSYFGQNYDNCRFLSKGARNAATVTQYVKLPENGFSETVQAVSALGPISVSVDASSWGSYTGGIFDGCNQTNPDINHAVQLVGYGTDPVGGDYWLVRNSWGTTWGENGYIRLKKNSKADTRCGVDITPLDGTGCRNGPTTQTVCGTCGILFDNSYPIVTS